MIRSTLIALATLSLVAGSHASAAAPCKDAKGKFMKCPTAPAKAVRCKDAKGKFAKCSAPGAKPVA
jgi:hypothetical protein